MKSNDPENSKLFATGTSLSDSRAWIFSLTKQLRDFFREWWTPSPAIVITAVPVEVGELWSKKQNHIPGLLSLLAHVVLITVAIAFSVVSYIKPKPIAETSVLVDPFTLSPPGSSIRSGGGGGGMRALTRASKGVLPRAAEFQLVPPAPIIMNMNPALVAEPTIIDVALTSIANRNLILQLGDPNGIPGPPSGGPGKNGGIGDGNDHGIGNKNGPYGPGPGNGPGGPDNTIVNIGKGGASPPSCPIPTSEPNYTDDARRGHVQGTVVLNVIVNKDGSVSVLDIAQKLGYGLDAEASQFVARSFRCKPGIYQGQPVATPVRIDVNFHLY
jgi:protein TonB